MKLAKFSTDCVSRDGIESGWTSALSGLMKPMLNREQWRIFNGRAVACETPLGIRLGVISGTPQQLSFLLGGAPDGIWMAQLLEGHALMIDGQKRVALGPGDIAYGPVRGASSLQFTDTFKLLFVRLPSAALNARLIHPPLAMRLNSHTGIGRILGAILKALAETIEDLPTDHERSIETLLREFIVINLMQDSQSAAGGGLVGVQAALLQRAYQIIDARLSEPDLTMKMVSAELKISLRYLYKLFASGGEGFGRYVKRRRLERCRCDLGNPLFDNFNVSEICFRWGFNEAAHFSRVFHEQYGLSPRAWRKEANAKRLADVAMIPRIEAPRREPAMLVGAE